MGRLPNASRKVRRKLDKFLLNLADEKKRELEAHDKVKPLEVQKPTADPSKQQVLDEIARQIEARQARRAMLAAEVKERDVEIKTAALRQAVAERVLGRLQNFEAQYEKFIAEARQDCIELRLSARDLVKVAIDNDTPTKILAEAKAAAEAGKVSKAALEEEGLGLQSEIDVLARETGARQTFCTRTTCSNLRLGTNSAQRSSETKTKPGALTIFKGTERPTDPASTANPTEGRP